MACLSGEKGVVEVYEFMRLQSDGGMSWEVAEAQKPRLQRRPITLCIFVRPHKIGENIRLIYVINIYVNYLSW